MRGAGRLRTIEDIENTFVKMVQGRPFTIGDAARVSWALASEGVPLPMAGANWLAASS